MAKEAHADVALDHSGRTGCVTANRAFPCVNRPQLPDEGAIYIRNSDKGAHNYPNNYPNNYPFTLGIARVLVPSKYFKQIMFYTFIEIIAATTTRAIRNVNG